MRLSLREDSMHQIVKLEQEILDGQNELINGYINQLDELKITTQYQPIGELTNALAEFLQEIIKSSVLEAYEAWIDDGQSFRAISNRIRAGEAAKEEAIRYEKIIRNNIEDHFVAIQTHEIEYLIETDINITQIEEIEQYSKELTAELESFKLVCDQKILSEIDNNVMASALIPLAEYQFTIIIKLSSVLGELSKGLVAAYTEILRNINLATVTNHGTINESAEKRPTEEIVEQIPGELSEFHTDETKKLRQVLKEFISLLSKIPLDQTQQDSKINEGLTKVIEFIEEHPLISDFLLKAAKTSAIYLAKNTPGFAILLSLWSAGKNILIDDDNKLKISAEDIANGLSALKTGIELLDLSKPEPELVEDLSGNLYRELSDPSIPDAKLPPGYTFDQEFLNYELQKRSNQVNLGEEYQEENHGQNVNSNYVNNIRYSESDSEGSKVNDESNNQSKKDHYQSQNIDNQTHSHFEDRYFTDSIGRTVETVDEEVTNPSHSHKSDPDNKRQSDKISHHSADPVRNNVETVRNDIKNSSPNGKSNSATLEQDELMQEDLAGKDNGLHPMYRKVKKDQLENGRLKIYNPKVNEYQPSYTMDEIDQKIEANYKGKSNQKIKPDKMSKKSSLGLESFGKSADLNNDIMSYQKSAGVSDRNYEIPKEDSLFKLVKAASSHANDSLNRENVGELTPIDYTHSLDKTKQKHLADMLEDIPKSFSTQNELDGAVKHLAKNMMGYELGYPYVDKENNLLPNSPEELITAVKGGANNILVPEELIEPVQSAIQLEEESDLFYRKLFAWILLLIPAGIALVSFTGGLSIPVLGLTIYDQVSKLLDIEKKDFQNILALSSSGGERFVNTLHSDYHLKEKNEKLYLTKNK